MKYKLILLFFLLLPVLGFSQSSGIKKVAVLDVVDKEGHVDYATKLMLRSTLAAAITNTPGYEGYDRVDISKIMGEQNFQRTGMVSDDQIRKLGEIAGVSYILVAEAAKFPDGHLFVTAKILDVESAKLESTSNMQCGTTDEELEAACNKLAASLFGLSSGSGNAAVSSYNSRHGQDQTFTVGGISFKMVYVHGGSFTMGATSEQGSNAGDDERPTHQVTLSDYYIGEYEVTQALWREVMGTSVYQQRDKANTSWSMYGVSDDHPMYYVSYNEAQEFCGYLNRKLRDQLQGKRFALPTEAQWEYAARGGNRSKHYKYAGSNDVSAVAYYDGNSSRQTHPAGMKQPNELGLYDMSGNVWEWCSDWYSSSYYSNSPSSNPAGPSTGSDRVLRGGSFDYDAASCRVSHRYDNGPGSRYGNYGFRLVLLP